MDFKEYLKNNIVILDGGLGTLLQKKGLTDKPESYNLTNPDIITDIHKSYFDNGSNVVNTNTFGVNGINYDDKEIEALVKSAVACAKKGKELSTSKQEKFIALDLGPSGKLLKPFGDLDFELCVNAYKKVIKVGVDSGVDLINIETVNDGYEAKAILLAVKETTSLPVLLFNAYNVDGRLITGATPEVMCSIAESMGADGIGANCSFGPKELMPIVKRLLKVSSIPVLLKPNAGLPKVVNGKTVYSVKPKEFSKYIEKALKYGVRCTGGCCGTDFEYIKQVSLTAKNVKVKEIKNKNVTCVSSFSKCVEFNNKAVIIGERINPTGKKRFKKALIENDIPYILNEAVMEQEAGAHVLDVNVGIPDIDEPKLIKEVISNIQAVSDLPLQIDTSNVNALETALRIYNGKPLINSVNGKQESMNSVFPLVKKYGGAVVCLLLDEKGIPNTAIERFNIAKKIIKTAQSFGIDKKNLIFDSLTLTVSSDKNAATVTLETLKLLQKLKVKTTLGISNVSFGLPNRDVINANFLTLCLYNGLSSCIINPLSKQVMNAYYSFNALNSLDENCSAYIESVAETVVENVSNENDLTSCIIKGLKEDAKKITLDLIKTESGLDIINNRIIPALNSVGDKFELKQMYLPQLLASAESAKYSFEVIKANTSTSNIKGNFVLATVKGDVHDIGKNIVRLLLENYGYNVIDLGKDVDKQTIVDAIIKYKAKAVGLSALMTTTVKSMEETISLIKENNLNCKIIVGGAVLTEEYAKKINADYYAKDAMETVKIAESVFDN